VIETPAEVFETTAGAVGLVVDQPATARILSTVGRDGSMVRRPFRWARSILGPYEVVPRFKVRTTVMNTELSQLVEANRQAVVEPSLEVREGMLVPTPGVQGSALDLTAIAVALDESAERGDRPIRVDATPIPVMPTFTDDVAAALAEEANALTDEPLTVHVGTVSKEIDPGTARTWFRTEVIGERLLLAPRSEAILAHLEQIFGDVATEPTPAHFDVVLEGDVPTPVIVDGTPGQRCCDDAATTAVFEALLRDQHDVEVGLGSTMHEQDRAWAESLGIVELVGEFTTNHACCENRVQNIHRIADLTRGVIIPAGETWSVNDFVGRRTTENGFVVAGVIQNGVFDESVGGGISQFATTLFNAAFFAGLEFDEYQAHSLYISRYPYGREATLSFPAPDLVLRNSTEHPVLLWPTYTDTSITVRLFSTKTVVGEQTGQSESAAGRCTRVTTERTRTWLEDGRTETDTVFAVYRPAEGVNCR
jgi:vancomycin resistance protein YoaR